MSISNGNKMIADIALEASGGKPKVLRYWDKDEKSSIDILSVIDRTH